MRCLFTNRFLSATFIVIALALCTTFASAFTEDDVWSEVRRKLDSYTPLPNIALIIGDDRGEIFVHEKGWYTRDTATRLWSASKWVSGMAIMRLVERGVMSLDDKPSKYIDYWTTDPSDWRSAITLKHLLTFTSGYGQPNADCLISIEVSLADCVREFYEGGFVPVGYPGAKFEYSEHHLLIAGQMAVIASGRDSYQQLIEQEIVIPNNVGQPFRYWNEAGARPGASLFTTPTWYARVLGAYVSGRVLKPETISLMETDYTPNGESGPNHYGMAHWIVCESVNLTSPCSSKGVQHSEGAQGYLPIVDRELDYWAVFANLGDFGNKDAYSFYMGTRSAIRKAVGISREVDSPPEPREENKVNSRLQRLGGSVVAIMKNLVRQAGGSYVPGYQGKFRDLGICNDQPYREQPIASTCSGFLVSPSQIATSSECIKDINECRSSFFVFDYALDERGFTRTNFKSDQVYTCLAYTTDARGNVIVTLDKQVLGRKPLKISATKIQTGESVIVIGHPNGLPRKYVERGSARASEQKAFGSFYITDTNAFGDFTGSPIIRKSDDTVVGIFKTKSTGLVVDLDKKCLVLQRCKSHFGNDDCSSNTASDATSISAYLNIPCKSNSDCSYSGSCSAGKCVCSEGFFGRDCSYAKGYEFCNNHGIFEAFERCACNNGYGGKYCEKEMTPPPSVAPAPQNTYSFGFGYSVSADGPVVAVGQPFCIPGLACDGGIVSILFDIGGTLTPIGQISNPEETADAQCGQKVVVRGDYAFVSCAASTIGSTSSAAIHIYQLVDNSFHYTKTVLPPTWDTIAPVDGLFGASLDVLMHFMLVGAPHAKNDDGLETGAAYFYLMTPGSDSGWELYPFKIAPADGQAGDNFGVSVAISMHSYHVEQLDWKNPPYDPLGSTYIGLSEQHAAVSNKPESRASSVYVYAFDPSGFRLKGIVTGSEFGSGLFASSFSLTPTSLIVGDMGYSYAGIQSGAVFVFDIRGYSEITLAQTLTPTSAHDGQLFGYHMAAYADVLVVFEGEASDAPSATRGFTVYKSRPNRVSYSATRNVASDFLPPNSAFGFDMAIFSSGVVVGAPLAEGDYPGRGVIVLFA